MNVDFAVIIHSPPPSNSPQSGGRTNSSPILGEARWGVNGYKQYYNKIDCL